MRPHALANITFADSTPNVNILPIWQGLASGTFAAHNINLSQVTLTASTITTALVSNSVQFVALNSAQVLIAKNSHLPVEVVSNWDMGQSIRLIMTTAFLQKKGITPGKTPIKTIVQDMVGSTGGSSSPVTTGQAYVLLKSYGVAPSEVTEASFASLPAVQAAFQKDSIDWFVASAPTPDVVQAGGYGQIVASRANAPAWRPTTINETLATTQSYAASNPGITREVVAGADEAIKYIHDHAQKSLNVLQANQPGVSRPILLKAIFSLIWPTSGKMDQHMWRVTIAFYVKSGQIPPGTTAVQDQDWTNKFVTH